MTTFEAYRSSKLPNNIYNPLANIYAAVNYAIHEYGRTLMRNGMGMGSGHGYDSGGYLQPGSTTAVNATGKPEAVLTPQESSAFVALAGSGGTSPLTSANSPLVRLNQTLVNPGGPIVVLNKTLTDPGGPMAYLQRTLANPGGPMVTLQKAIVNPGGPVSTLGKAIVNPGGPLTGLSKTIADPGGPMVDLKTTIANPGGPMVALTTALKNFNPGGPEKSGGGGGAVKLPGGKLGSTAGKGKPPIKATHPAGSGINPGGPNTPAGGASGAPVYNINVNYNGTKPSAEDHAAAMIRLSAAIGVA